MISSPSMIRDPHVFHHGARDPAGRRSVGDEVVVDREPSGYFPGERNSVGKDDGPMPPTPTRHPSSTALLAILVGDPPPPPPNAPSPRKHRTSPKKAMTDIRQSRTERKHPDVQYIVTSTEYHQGVVSPRDTLSPSDQNHEMFRRDGTSDPTFFDKNMTIVNIDGAQKSGRDSPELNPHRKSTGGSSQPVQQPESPVSGSSHTEPVRNHVATDEDMENLTRSANTFVRTNPLETTKTPKAGTLKVLRPFTPQRARRSLTPDKRRSKTPNPRSSARVVSVDISIDSKNKVTSEHRSDKRSKKGFFRKIFGVRKKKENMPRDNDSVTVDVSESKSLANRSKEQRAAAKRMKRPVEQTPGMTFMSQGIDETGRNADREVFFSHDEVSTLTAPTFESKRRTDPSAQTLDTSDPNGHYYNNSSLVPIEEGDVDPFTAAFFGDLSNDAKLTDHATSPGASRLAITIDTAFEPAVGLSIQEKRHSLNRVSLKDPSPRGQDTLLYTVQDPSPRGAAQDQTSSRSSETGGVGLCVQDPSPRGPLKVYEDLYKDPVGESPLHKYYRGPVGFKDGSPYTPDPPLHLQNLSESEDDSCSSEEKKMDDPNLMSAMRAGLSINAEGGHFLFNQPEKVVRLPQVKIAVASPQASPRPRTTSSRPPTPPRMKMMPVTSVQHRPKDAVSASPRLSSSRDSVGQQCNYELETISSGLSVNILSVPQLNRKDGSSKSKDTRHEGKVQEALIRKSTGSRAPETSSESFFEENGGPIDSDLVWEKSSKVEFRNDIEERQTDPQTKSKSLRTSNKSFTISTAARLNAKTVAYIHTINGEPSPRKAWGGTSVSDDDSSPTNCKMPMVMDAEKTVGTFHQMELVDEYQSVKQRCFAPYSSKFKGRKPLKGGTAVKVTEFRRRVQKRSSPHGEDSSEAKFSFVKEADDKFPFDAAFSIGAKLLRQRREEGLRSGRLMPSESRKTSTPKARSYFASRIDPEPRDPIQRAGRRLLAKAAVPIQAGARRFLAQREAVNRMWALIEIQSYMRRWKAQASLYAYRHCALTLQRVYRGMQIRNHQEKLHGSATQIQKLVRGYLAAVKTFDTVYRIILVQARARGNAARDLLRMMKEENNRRIVSARLLVATRIQACWRCKAMMKRYQVLLKNEKASKAIQTWWRCQVMRVRYRGLIDYVTFCQSVVRRWRTRRDYSRARDLRRNSAAVKIQATWRGFQGYTDFIFSLVDVIVVQRTVRQWLAKREAGLRLRERSAVKLQSNYRRYKAQMRLLVSLMHIIQVQSVVRRYLVKTDVAKKRDAAVKIQTAWRGFWQFSHYVITLYEITRLQAISRGFVARKRYMHQVSSCIAIQSVARRYISFKECNKHRESRALLQSRAQSLREKHACQRIQFWWRVVLDCRKEKKAALVIEKFFLMVKREVDKEIERVARKKNSKREKRKKKKAGDGSFAQKSFLNSWDDYSSDGFASITSYSTGVDASFPRNTANLSFESKGYGRNRSQATPRSESSTLKLSNKKGDDNTNDALNLTYSDDGSEFSSSAAMRFYQPRSPGKSVASRADVTVDESLEEALREDDSGALRATSEKVRSAQKYLKMYGVRTPSTKPIKVNHFFADDLSTTMSGMSSSSSIQGIKYTITKSDSHTPTHSDSKTSKRLPPLNENPPSWAVGRRPRDSFAEPETRKSRNHAVEQVDFFDEEFGLI